MSNTIAPGSSADVNVKVTALTTNPNVPVTYKTIILKKNLVNGVNTLTQEMMSTQNTKYVIKYDYVLGGDVTVPASCILEFDGGSISGEHTVTGQNTGIQAGLVKIFNTYVTLSGSWNINYAYPQWFGIMPNDSTKDSSSFLKMMCSLSINTYWCNGNWYFSPTIINGAHGFSIIGESQLRTVFRLFNPTGNASYIIKFGGKEDFTEFLDSDPDYHTYYTTHFTVSGIIFHEEKGELVNYNPNDGDLKYAAVIFDACVEGTINLEFNCYDPAVYIRTTWEMMFEKLFVYYGGMDNDNFGIPKIIIGSATRGSSVNANTFIDIKGEALNGPVVKVMPNGNFTHCIINNIFFEGRAKISNSYPNIITGDSFIANLNNYVKDSNYDIDNIIDFTDGKVNITIGNITFDGDSIYAATSINKPLVRTILGISSNNYAIIGNVEIVEAAVLGFIYIKSQSLATGNVSIGGFVARPSYNNDYGFVKSLIVLSDNYANCNVNSLTPINIFTFPTNGAVASCADIMNIIKLNKYYDGREMEEVLYNGINVNYRQSNIIPDPYIGAFSFNNKLAIYSEKAIFKLPQAAIKVDIAFNLYNTTEEISGIEFQESHIVNGSEIVYQNVTASIISLGNNNHLVKATITTHSDGIITLYKSGGVFRINGFIVTMNEE